jgi:DNA-binding NarL/FixJ family response regulator
MFQDCLAAVEAGQAHAVVSIDELSQLPAALLAASSGFSCVSFKFVEQRMQAPVLTDRQKCVLKGIFDGLTNKTIARCCGVSHTTVKREVANLLRALGVHNRVELVTKAMELGFAARPR